MIETTSSMEAQTGEDSLTAQLLSSVIIDSPLDTSSTKSTYKLHIPILRPLAIPSILHLCRTFKPAPVRMQDGTVCSYAKDEILNITPFTTAWRKAFQALEIPSADSCPIEIIFDISLPRMHQKPAEDEVIGEKKSAEVSSKMVYWETSTPEGGGLLIMKQNILNLLLTLAIRAKMKVGKGDIEFVIVSSEDDAVERKAFDRTRKYLSNLAAQRTSK